MIYERLEVVGGCGLARAYQKHDQATSHQSWFCSSRSWAYDLLTLGLLFYSTKNSMGTILFMHCVCLQTVVVVKK